MAEPSPMVKQYQEIKAAHRDAILFFRLGDFYEMFNEDAELASRELELTLTGRGKDDNRMPMCGIPYHAAENYIARLIAKGYKVAICEQVEDPAVAKGVVRREVTRVITPGTVWEEGMLVEKRSNYLLAVNEDKGKFGLAYVESSTGEFRLTDLSSADKLLDEIRRLNPAEIIIADLLGEELKKEIRGISAATEFSDIYDRESAERKLLKHFKLQSLQSFGLSGREVALGAAAAILDYLSGTQKTALGQINKLTSYRSEDFLFIDAITRRNLELTQTVREKGSQGSLLWLLDQTRTAMGSRLLRQWLLYPLLDRSLIEARLSAVAELVQDGILRAELAENLSRVFDLERLTGKAAIGSANARDLVALKESLRQLPAIRRLLKKTSAPLLRRLLEGITGEEGLFGFEKEIISLIGQVLVDDPPFVVKEGGLIKSGYHAELDELKKAASGGKQWIADLEARERKRTGIKSLKIGFTKVFGYYIEVTNANLDQVPADYIRKQTLVNAERFITPELKEQESLILHAAERLKELEYELFCQLRDKVASFAPKLQGLSAQLAELDVLLSLAELAVSQRYSRPKINEQGEIRIKGGRHPVVERTQGTFNFTPNDTVLDKNVNFLLITGPNMGGKSTYMRQVALICLLAQIGSFVPADSADLPLLDRIFTRIGAMDDIYSGQSTFMVEMIETANILNNATPRSLIILDEIGRGTATFDGMSIAAAVAEFIQTNFAAKTLFATHYHELTQLAEKHPGMKNVNVAVREEGERIVFLHKVQPGAADRSYGIQVARLAGLPAAVIDRAKEIYETLEMVENNLGDRPAIKKSRHSARGEEEGRAQASLF